ncbi:MAG TPA: hypothetical protein H9986_08815 [Candidatus Prevotella stercoripullorum]|nr:hypothetical protein [Candidatus Prevotella stercoripullorum]
MTRNYPANNGTLLQTACAIVFLLFVFVYLYFFQADLLSMVQHVLSGGATHYDRTIGTVIITAVLYLVHLGAKRLGGLDRVCHALSYFPSLLLLAALTDVEVDFSVSPLRGLWLWLAPLLLAVYVFLSLAVKYNWIETLLPSYSAPISVLWKNLLLMACMFIAVCLCGNNDSVLHYRLRVERLLGSGAYSKALMVGEKSDETDASLTMLRIYALSRSGQLGERLFEFPLTGGSYALLPDGKGVRCLLYPEDRMVRALSIRKKGDMTPMEYLLYIERNGLGRKPVTDYILCGYLLDRNIDAFVNAIRRKYSLTSPSLPKHYKEALTLYTHLRSNPVLVYHNEVIDADYADFQNLEHKYTDARERESYVRDMYGDTYWFYYFYHRK